VLDRAEIDIKEVWSEITMNAIDFAVNAKAFYLLNGLTI
jgi:hypothetical protein